MFKRFFKFEGVFPKASKHISNYMWERLSLMSDGWQYHVMLLSFIKFFVFWAFAIEPLLSSFGFHDIALRCCFEVFEMIALAFMLFLLCFPSFDFKLLFSYDCFHVFAFPIMIYRFSMFWLLLLLMLLLLCFYIFDSIFFLEWQRCKETD